MSNKSGRAKSLGWRHHKLALAWWVREVLISQQQKASESTLNWPSSAALFFSSTFPTQLVSPPLSFSFSSIPTLPPDSSINICYPTPSQPASSTRLSSTDLLLPALSLLLEQPSTRISEAAHGRIKNHNTILNLKGPPIIQAIDELIYYFYFTARLAPDFCSFLPARGSTT